MRVVGDHYCECVGAFEFSNGRTDREWKILAVLQMVLDAMCDDFRIRLGFEFESLLFQVVAKLLIVFNNAIVDDRDCLA